MRSTRRRCLQFSLGAMLTVLTVATLAIWVWQESRPVYPSVDEWMQNLPRGSRHQRREQERKYNATHWPNGAARTP